MLNNYHLKTGYTCVVLFLVCTVLPLNKLAAQQLRMYDFVLFAGNGSVGTFTPAAPGYGVQLASSSGITGGSIGSLKLITTTGNSTLNTNLYSRGTVALGNGNSVSGKITAANSPAVAGTVVSIGSNANITGNIDVNGNIVVGGGIVSGSVTHPMGTTYTGPAPAGGNITGTPTLPVFPSLPAVKTFTIPSNAQDITNNKTVNPGEIWKNVTLPGNKTLKFSDTGTYYFNSFNLTNANTIEFNFNNHPGVIRIYVLGNMLLDKVSTSLLNGASANKIFIETNGNNASVAFKISNGNSNSRSRWTGTVWAPYAGIDIGSGTGNTDITGALWSGTQVNIQSGVNLIYAPFNDCTPPNANAGFDKPASFSQNTILTGSSTTASVSYNWEAFNGGIIVSPVNATTISVSTAGTYVFTVSTSSTCFTKDTVLVTSKVNNLIGSELLSLYQNYDPANPASPFYIIQSDNVVIDIIVKEGRYNDVLTLLQTPAYGLTQIRSNGGSPYIITGLFPISKLPSLNLLTDLINYCRPLYAPVSGYGIASTQGDIAMRSNFIRNGYGLDGEGMKVGVISDSYNTIPGNPAGTDVGNGDLPGAANPNGYTDEVTILQDFPFGRGIDEGRAMTQIVHDIAPKAKKYFRTGFISPGDMAQGIRELKQNNCDVIVDDITYITEPFLQDGVVARAVNEVSSQGTAYFCAAGNFANKSYQSNFNAAPAPAGITGIHIILVAAIYSREYRLNGAFIPSFFNGPMIFIP